MKKNKMKFENIQNKNVMLIDKWLRNGKKQKAVHLRRDKKKKNR